MLERGRIVEHGSLVTEALLVGDHTSLWENVQRERKVQVFPDLPDLRLRSGPGGAVGPGRRASGPAQLRLSLFQLQVEAW